MTGPARVLIAGGTSGIGLGMARAWRRRGHSVVAFGRRPERAAAAVGEGITVVGCDITSAASLEQLLATHGAFDIVVCCSAVSAAPLTRFAPGMAPIAESSVRQELQTNIGGAVLLAQAWLSRLQPDAAGTFVLVGSPVGLAPATALLYATSKGACHTFASGLRHQLRNTALRVVEVLPPAVDTPLNPLLIRKSQADDVGERAVAGVMRGARDVVYVGPTWVVALLSRLLPSAAMTLVDMASKPRE